MQRYVDQKVMLVAIDIQSNCHAEFNSKINSFF